MRRVTYHTRTFTHHWRISLAVALGVAAGTAALAGALLVGDSMRESLKALAIGRLGRVDYAMIAQRFFLETLADRIAAAPGFSDHFAAACPAILLRGGVTHAERRTRVNNVDVLGVDDRFWKFHGVTPPTRGDGTSRFRGVDPPKNDDASGQAPGAFAGRIAYINDSFATELNAKPGDEILLRMGKPSTISTETLLGRRDETTATLRLTVAGIFDRDHLGDFSLNLRQAEPRNVFVPLETLQKAVSQDGRANTILVTATKAYPPGLVTPEDHLQLCMQSLLTLEDVGLRLRIHRRPERVEEYPPIWLRVPNTFPSFREYVAIESESILIEPKLEDAIIRAAEIIQAHPTRVLAYLANEIRKPSELHGVPYSTIVAFPLPSRIWATHMDTLLILKPGEIILNEWTAQELDAVPGDEIDVRYFVHDQHGELETRTSTFKLARTISLAHWLWDAGLVPTYPGVTDAKNLSDWDAPFPLDLTRIRPEDEDYWESLGTTPKAVIRLEEGQSLWTSENDRFGRVTAIQLNRTPQSDLHTEWLATLADDFRSEFRKATRPELLGLTFDPIRAQALQSSKGTTDFGQLFLGFSFFLIISAALLVALLFRLGVERRAAEVGILLATGFTPRAVTGLLLIDGALIALVGTLVGLVGAVGYAGLMLAGLLTWWSSAVNAPKLVLYVSPTSLAIGAAASLLVALFAIVWAVRGLTRSSPRALLAGATVGLSSIGRPTHRSRSVVIAAAGFILAAGLIALAVTLEATAKAGAFFGAGACLLVAFLGIFHRMLQYDRSRDSHGAAGEVDDQTWRHLPGGAERRGQAPTLHLPSLSITRLGLRNAGRYPARSLLTAGLIASATFIIFAVDSFRLETDPEALRAKTSGSGGFSLYAEAAAALPYDLGTPVGRSSLGFDADAEATLSKTAIVPFRFRPGDQSSCLSLYRPTEPRMLGASDQMIERGGFDFAGTLAESPEEHADPWTLLRKQLPDGAIPAIGDAAAVQWQFHLGLGRDLIIKDERGNQRPVRFVALLRNSVLQDEVIISEQNFISLFPSITGQGFFLIEAPQAESKLIEQLLEQRLERFSFDAASTVDRLHGYLSVQNTYLSTFRTLGGLGLVLGTIGLGAVLLRNVWERRRELALLLAVGFDRRGVAWLVLAENAGLLAIGLGMGAVAAVVAMMPTLIAEPTTVPWGSTMLTLATVFGVGMVSGVVALIPALRTPVVLALRSE